MISDRLFKSITHSELKEKLVARLRECGAHVQPIENLGTRGVPDLNCCYYGHEFWLEIKVKPDKLSRSQIKWINDRRIAGGTCFIISKEVGYFLCIGDNEEGKSNKSNHINEVVDYILTKVQRALWTT